MLVEEKAIAVRIPLGVQLLVVPLSHQLLQLFIFSVLLLQFGYPARGRDR
jgi:hypothetical protein